MRPSNPYHVRLLVSDRNGPIADVFPPDDRSTHTRVSGLYVHRIRVFSADAVVVMPDDVLAIGQSINARCELCQRA
jgi:adenine/guanine phosphoribosyltransferase-like PRPP-binding protein